MKPYVGRFAPSPTGPLHAGSLVAALASWLDARAHGGRWLLRIEDVDRPRCPPGFDDMIVAQLARCGLQPDEPPLWQHTREPAYASALAALVEAGRAYPCTCTRRDIEAAWRARGTPRERHADLVYPGTCWPPGQPRSTAATGRAPAWRLHVPAGDQHWTDRRIDTDARTTHARTIHAQVVSEDARQDVAGEVGDFVLRRADGLWAYQLAVVVDDAFQGVTDVVRGADLADNTARQIVLQQALGLPTPRYLHTPLVLGDDGEKLSKQNGARALALDDPLAALRQAAAVLGLPADATALRQAATPADWLTGATALWSRGPVA